MTAVLLVLVLSNVAQADASSQSPAGYEEAIAQALTELAASNYPEAREEFRRAHALFPNARTLRGLAMIEFELRNYGECLLLMQQSLASTIRPLEAKMRADGEELMARARRYLGEVRIETDPSRTMLVVDGVSQKVDKAGSVLLDVGEHTLEFQASGYAAERRVIQVNGGERTVLRVSLTPLGPLRSDAQQLPSGRSPDVQPVYKKWWVWSLVAVVAVGGATATALLLARDRNRAKEPQGGNMIGVRLNSLRSF